MLVYAGDDFRVQELYYFVRHQFDNLNDGRIAFSPQAVNRECSGDEDTKHKNGVISSVFYHLSVSFSMVDNWWDWWRLDSYLAKASLGCCSKIRSCVTRNVDVVR